MLCYFFLFEFWIFRTPQSIIYSILFSVGNSGSGPPVSEDHTVAAHTPRAASARILQLHVRHTHTHAKIRIFCFTALNDVRLSVMTPFKLFSPPFLLHIFLSHALVLRMRLRKECEEAMHSIAMITIRLQSCLSVEHRIHTLWVYLSCVELNKRNHTFMLDCTDKCLYDTRCDTQ